MMDTCAINSPSSVHIFWRTMLGDNIAWTTKIKTTKKRKPRSPQNKQTQQNSRGLVFATTADVDVYCKKMKLSKHVCDHVSQDILSGRVKGDIRSYRQDNVAYKDRIPAEYRCPSTPPRYWSLEDIGEPISLNPLEVDI